MEILTSVKRLYISFKYLVNDFVYSFGRAALQLLVEVQNHTVPIRKCRRIRVIALGTYYGASVIMRSTFDWNRSSISKFEFDAVPHSWIPQVQTGNKIIGKTLLSSYKTRKIECTVIFVQVAHKVITVYPAEIVVYQDSYKHT